MMDERSVGPRIEQHRFPGLLGEIYRDVARSIDSLAGDKFETEEKRDLKRRLSLEILQTRSSVSNRMDSAYKILGLIYGEDFLTHKDEEKRRRIYEISSASSPDDVVNVALEEAYRRYQESRSSTRLKWSHFVKLYQVASGKSRDHNFEASIPRVSRVAHITLPNYQSEYDMKLNTTLQTAYAKGIGLFNPQDDWDSFLTRDSIIVVAPGDLDAFVATVHKNPSAVVGMQEPSFYHVPTKYEGAYATIQFSLLEGEKGLVEKIKSGRATPEISLSFPTDILLAAK